MNNFIGFIQKDVVSFCDSLLQSLYTINKKSESNNVVSRCHKINYLVKQIKDANYLLHNELKLLQSDINYQKPCKLKTEKKR